MSKPSTITIAPAHFPQDIAMVRALFVEYINSLGIDLSFQDVDAELAKLPGKYAFPAGMILLARDSTSHAMGCVAMRPLSEDGVCEMKRLYVCPQARGHHLGRRLVVEIMERAKNAGYTRIVLDTLSSMQAARNLYASLGFCEVAPYYENPMTEAIYLARDLGDSSE